MFKKKKTKHLNNWLHVVSSGPGLRWCDYFIFWYTDELSSILKKLSLEKYQPIFEEQEVFFFFFFFPSFLLLCPKQCSPALKPSWVISCQCKGHCFPNSTSPTRRVRQCTTTSRSRTACLVKIYDSIRVLGFRPLFLGGYGSVSDSDRWRPEGAGHQNRWTETTDFGCYIWAQRWEGTTLQCFNVSGMFSVGRKKFVLYRHFE